MDETAQNEIAQNVPLAIVRPKIGDWAVVSHWVILRSISTINREEGQRLPR